MQTCRNLPQNEGRTRREAKQQITIRQIVSSKRTFSKVTNYLVRRAKTHQKQSGRKRTKNKMAAPGFPERPGKRADAKHL